MEKTSSSVDIIFKYFGDFTQSQIEQWKMLMPIYKEWNEKINIISRKDIDSLYEKHVLHSLSIAAVFNFEPGSKIIDIGTGGGFPGMPLAIFFPEVQFHLVDSIAKKLKVAQAVVDVLELKNVTVQHIRVENIKNKKFDYAISRAVAPLKDLWKWSKPLLYKRADMKYPNGLICLKGGDLTTEIAESNLKPHLINIDILFKETYFKEKYLLHIVR